MGLLTDAVRPFWLRGLNEVSGKQIKEIAGWVSDEDYQIYDDVLSKSFILNVSDSSPLLRSYAAEIDRIASAGFETIARIEATADSRSIAWQCIQHYYSAFFAAHSLLRILGTGCNTLGKAQCNSVLKVASAWGVDIPASLPGGLYCFSYDIATQEFLAKHVAAGPHESFWKLFDAKIAEVANSILTSQANFTADVRARQIVALKLGQLRSNLSGIGAAQATWLTQMRNGINYDHKWATWWPYSGRPKYYDKFKSQSAIWRSDPLDIELTLFDEREILRFQATCNFLVAMCRETLQDLADRCPGGNSFLRSGTIAYWNFAKMLS